MGSGSVQARPAGIYMYTRTFDHRLQVPRKAEGTTDGDTGDDGGRKGEI